VDIKQMLQRLEKLEGSDLYLSTGACPTVKVQGKLVSIEDSPLEKGACKQLAFSLMDEEKRQSFLQLLEANFAYALNEKSRFRVNVFMQRNEVGMVVRRIQTVIPTIESLGLPTIIKEIIMEKRGLVLFVGATGCGKSTSLASLINYRNENSACHIITIEDPIEFVHEHKKSIVNQREVGLDTLSYQEALKNTLRQAPDVILIGEIRAQDTMEHAIAFSETGHLCLSTLHANNANQAFDRIINFFTEERRNQLLLDLSLNVRAIISQRLVNTIDNKRTIAVEILLGTPLILSLIHRGEIHLIKEVMEKSTNLGMQTFDQSLEDLYFDGVISLKEALRNADSKNNLRLKISLSKRPHPAHTQPEDLLYIQQKIVEENTPNENHSNKKESPAPGLTLIDDE